MGGAERGTDSQNTNGTQFPGEKPWLTFFPYLVLGHCSGCVLSCELSQDFKISFLAGWECVHSTSRVGLYRHEAS